MRDTLKKENADDLLFVDTQNPYQHETKTFLGYGKGCLWDF